MTKDANFYRRIRLYRSLALGALTVVILWVFIRLFA